MSRKGNNQNRIITAVPEPLKTKIQQQIDGIVDLMFDRIKETNLTDDSIRLKFETYEPFYEPREVGIFRQTVIVKVDIVATSYYQSNKPLEK